MNDLTQRKIRFGDAAAALGMNASSLRNWFARNQIVLFSQPPAKGWAEFTLGDVAVLALMRRLVRWGFPVDYANEIAMTDIHRLAGPLFLHRNTPAAALLSAIEGRVLFARFPEDGDEAEAGIVTREESSAFLAAWDEAARTGAPAICQDVLLIDLRPVIAAAFDRLGSAD